MGHLPICDPTTFALFMDGYVAIRSDLRKLMEKTTADIFSDALATRPGQPIFPWVINGCGDAGWGFKHVFTVSDEPLFVAGDAFPIRIPLREEYLDFEVALAEEKALDLWRGRLLWNAIGKKSLGRGRSLTHQLPMEDDELLRRLREVNRREPRRKTLRRRGFKGAVPIQMPTTGEGWDRNRRQTLERLQPGKRLGALDPVGLSWRRGGLFTHEKALEGWIMQNIDREAGASLVGALPEPIAPIEWFGNYLPYGVAGANIDVLLLQRGTDDAVATVIELKKDPLNVDGMAGAAAQVLEYSHFIADAMRAFDVAVVMRAAVISGAQTGKRRAKPTGLPEVTWIEYRIEPDGQVLFERVP